MSPISELHGYAELLGWRVKDVVTGFTGTVSHLGIDLYGCIQATVTPAAVKDKDGLQKIGDSRWFDVARLQKLGKARVMQPIPAKVTETAAPSGGKAVAGGFDKPAK